MHSSKFPTICRKRPQKTEVWLNERDFLLSTETENPTIKIKVAKLIVHPEYGPLSYYNDISLLELSESVDVTKTYLRPICLPENEEFDPLEKGIVEGYPKYFKNNLTKNDFT